MNTLELLDSFAHSVKTGDSWTPRELKLYVTSRCNSRCVMCSVWTRDQNDSPELPLSRIEQMSAEARDLGITRVTITGGEPTLRHDLPEIVAAFSSCGIVTRLITNCVSLTDELLERLVAARLHHLLVSLDSTTDAANDALRGVDGAFQLVTRAVKHARELPQDQRPAITMLTVLHRYSLEVLRSFPELLKHLGVSDWQFSPMKDPQDVGALNSFGELKLSSQDVSFLNHVVIPELINSLPAEMSTYYMHRFHIFDRPPALDRSVPWPVYSLRPASRCFIPWSSMIVRADGLVVGCNRVRNPVLDIGNVMETTLIDLWQNNNMRRFRRLCADSSCAPFDGCTRCCWNVQRRHWLVQMILSDPARFSSMNLKGFPRRLHDDWLSCWTS